MKTMLGGFADGRAPPEAARIANPIVPAAAARRSSRRVIGSLRANTIGPPLRGCNLCYTGALHSRFSGSAAHTSRRALWPPQQQAVHAAAHVPEVGFVPPFKLNDGAARVTNFTKGLAHGFPVH